MSQFPENSMKPTRPNMDISGQPQMPDAEKLQALAKFANMIRGGQEYVPISKSLEAIGIDPAVKEVMLDDGPVECLVIPIKELMEKEWRHMSGDRFKLQQP
jgi:hypothetical protein